MRILLALTLLAFSAVAQQPPKGNPEESARKRAEMIKANPPRSSTGMIPLTDLGAGMYKGKEGGLYAGGQNVPPSDHLKAGVRIGANIKPINRKIVLMSIGFSNPSIEFPAFQKRVAEDHDVNPNLVTVNGCVGSQSASMIADPNANYWNIVNQRLEATGVTAEQVQAVWLKEVNPGQNAWDTEVKRLHDNEVSILHILHDRFPNLKTTYVTSRSYGGYASFGSPEPAAYETGFAVKALINGQIEGSPELNYDSAKGPVRSPWIEWGPYIWTDGEKGRKDGFVHLKEDVREDQLHPSEKGSAKISAMMLAFFKTDPTTKSWFLK